VDAGHLTSSMYASWRATLGGRDPREGA
jgi:hypothetical protein